jgi:hypothetical protein
MNFTVTYTAISPTDDVISMICCDFDRALELAEADLQREFVPVTISVGPLQWDIEAIAQALTFWRVYRHMKEPA